MTSDQEPKWCIGCWAKLDSEHPACTRCGRGFIVADQSTYYSRQVGYLSVLDFHVVYLCLMLGLLGVFVPWPAWTAVILFLIPQPMIVTQSLDRYLHKCDEQKWNTNYVMVNEIFVVFLAMATFVVSELIRR